MIKRVRADINEGDIIEFNGQSEPLYIYHHGELIKISSYEYSLCTTNIPEKRWSAIFNYRINNTIIV